MRMPQPLLIGALALASAALTGCQCGECQDQEAETATTVMAEGAVDDSAPINNICPVGREPVTEDSPTATYKGYTLAFCCDSCSTAFMEWDQTARDRWLVAATRDPNHLP